MGKNDFRVDTTSSEKKTFFKKKQTLLGLAFLLTVPQMLKVQMRTMRNTKKAMPLATRQGIMTGNSK